MKKLGIIIACLFIVSSCTSINNRGQYVDDKQISTVHIAKTTKEDLIENFGTPNFISEFNKNKWYYVSRTTKNNFLNRPKIVSQRVLIVEFNSNNILSSFDLQDNKNLNDLVIRNDKTIVEGTEKGLLNTYIGNIGKFSKSSKKKGKNK